MLDSRCRGAAQGHGADQGWNRLSKGHHQGSLTRSYRLAGTGMTRSPSRPPTDPAGPDPSLQEGRLHLGRGAGAPCTHPAASRLHPEPPRGIFISPLRGRGGPGLPDEPSPSDSTLLHTETPELQTPLCGRFNCESRCSIPSVLGTDLSLESQFVSLLHVSEEIIKAALPGSSP